MDVERLKTDVLVLGSGGAGLFAALHAHAADPMLDITIATKGLLGKCGCTRMVQGGYNVALHPGDSVERHFMDTIEGGKWLCDQDLAWTLVTKAVERITELENEIGCFFDRNPDGTLHGKAFAGQTFDRTVHKGDLTGIEIVNRLMEQVWARPAIRRLEEHRAVGLIPSRDGASIAGALHRVMAEYDPALERATRDVVSRAMYAEMRAGRTSPHGGLYIKMSHLGADNVRRAFKGMVERCADCGFDLAGGLVEVVPTAHYFMGGVICRTDALTEMPGLFVAGEDASGMHGANRLGGNGVANSTVFGGIAGDSMARWIKANAGHHAPDESVIEAEAARALHPFTRKPGDLNRLRERLLDIMWEDVGV